MVTTSEAQPPPPHPPQLTRIHTTIPLPDPSSVVHTGLLSPQIDQNGAFATDRVIKSGWLMKRGRKSKSYKRRWFVLRPDRLQIYKDSNEYKVLSQVILSEVTAIAMLKPKGHRSSSSSHSRASPSAGSKSPQSKSDDDRRDFGIFTAPRNYHLQSQLSADAKAWVEALRGAASIAIQEEDDEILVTSPDASRNENPMPFPGPSGRLQNSASPENAVHAHHTGNATDPYSGAEMGSGDSISDIGMMSQLSLNEATQGHLKRPSSSAHQLDTIPSAESTLQSPAVKQIISPPSGTGLDSTQLAALKVAYDTDKTLWHGWIYTLKPKMRQWKKLWLVLRMKNLAIYKTDEEFKPVRLISMDTIIDCVEIDPLSKSKKYCMQVITERKSYRFCAIDEPGLEKWLGSFKSAIAKRRALGLPGGLSS